MTAQQSRMAIPLTLPPIASPTLQTFVRVDSDGLWHRPGCREVYGRDSRERFGQGYYRADVADVHDFPIGGPRAIGACCKPS